MGRRWKCDPWLAGKQRPEGKERPEEASPLRDPKVDNQR
jgi:hypothetical protein